MAIVILCIGSALIGYILGLLMANRIADMKIAEMRLEMGLDVETGEEIPTGTDELYHQLFKED